MSAAYGPVVDIKAVPSQGVSKITIEVPIEHHLGITNLLYGQNCLITLAPEFKPAMPFGLVESNSDGTARIAEGRPRHADASARPKGTATRAKQEPLGKYALLAVQLCKMEMFHRWAQFKHPKIWGEELGGLDGHGNEEAAAKAVILHVCEVESRKNLDAPGAADRFERRIRRPYMNWEEGKK